MDVEEQLNSLFTSSYGVDPESILGVFVDAELRARAVDGFAVLTQDEVLAAESCFRDPYDELDEWEVEESHEGTEIDGATPSFAVVAVGSTTFSTAVTGIARSRIKEGSDAWREVFKRTRGIYRSEGSPGPGHDIAYAAAQVCERNGTFFVIEEDRSEYASQFGPYLTITQHESFNDAMDAAFNAPFVEWRLPWPGLELDDEMVTHWFTHWINEGDPVWRSDVDPDRDVSVDLLGEADLALAWLMWNGIEISEDLTPTALAESALSARS